MKLFKAMLLRGLDTIKKSSLLIAIKKDFTEILHFLLSVLKGRYAFSFPLYQ